MAKKEEPPVYRVAGEYVDANGKPAEAPQQAKPAKPEEDPRQPVRPPVTGSAGTAGFDVNTATREELEAEAERRGITVTRGDGQDGAPLKADYVAALSK